jgi:hypothetical protein
MPRATTERSPVEEGKPGERAFADLTRRASQTRDRNVWTNTVPNIMPEHAIGVNLP